MVGEQHGRVVVRGTPRDIRQSVDPVAYRIARTHPPTSSSTPAGHPPGRRYLPAGGAAGGDHRRPRHRPWAQRRRVIQATRAMASPGCASASVEWRGLEVLTLIARRLSNTEIAQTLHVSLATDNTPSGGYWPNSAPATARNWSSSPTKPASSGRADMAACS
jgi:hypothetical protein